MLRSAALLLLFGLLALPPGAAAQEPAPPGDTPPPVQPAQPAPPAAPARPVPPPPAAVAVVPAPGQAGQSAERPPALDRQAERRDDPGSCWAGTSNLQAEPLIRRTAQDTGRSAMRRLGISVRLAEDAPVSGTSVHVLLEAATAGVQWRKVQLYGAAWIPARSGTRTEPGLAYAPIYANLLRDRIQEGIARVELELPRRNSWHIDDMWEAVIAICDPSSGVLLDFGAFSIAVRSPYYAVLAAGLLVATLYVLLGLAALQIHRGRLRRALRGAARNGTRREALGFAMNPLFISQDASGVASLGRLQLLAFTFAVVWVSAYVFFRTDNLAGMSEDVLKLLGITVAGSTLARTFGDSGSVSTANRLWLRGNRVIVSGESRLPVLRDLICADGEIEVSRVQALVFSLLTILALLVRGPRDLGSFQISEQMLYLLGISQLVFVAGKALPAEPVRRLNQELDAVRAAERGMRDARARFAATAAQPAPDAAELARATEALETAKSAWNAALTAVEGSLTEIYGASFDRAAFSALRAA